MTDWVHVTDLCADLVAEPVWSDTDASAVAFVCAYQHTTRAVTAAIDHDRQLRA